MIADPRCLEVYPTRCAWLAGRREACRIGGSDVGSILGADGAYGGPWSVWAQKMGLSTPGADNLDMQRGRRWERRILDLYGEESERQVLLPWQYANLVSYEHHGAYDAPTDAYVLLRHPDAAWAICSPDGFVDDGTWGGVEVKTDRRADRWAAGPRYVYAGWDEAWPAPLSYVLQVYWSLAVSGLPFWDLVVLLPHYELRSYRFEADPVLQSRLLTKIGAWRTRHLVGCEPPEIDESEACADYYVARASSDADERPGTDEDRALVDEYVRARVELRQAQARAERLRNELMKRVGGAAGLRFPDGAQVNWQERAGYKVPAREVAPSRYLSVWTPRKEQT